MVSRPPTARRLAPSLLATCLVMLILPTPTIADSNPCDPGPSGYCITLDEGPTFFEEPVAIDVYDSDHQAVLGHVVTYTIHFTNPLSGEKQEHDYPCFVFENQPPECKGDMNDEVEPTPVYYLERWSRVIIIRAAWYTLGVCVELPTGPNCHTVPSIPIVDAGFVEP